MNGMKDANNKCVAEIMAHEPRAIDAVELSTYISAWNADPREVHLLMIQNGYRMTRPYYDATILFVKESI